MRIVVTLEDDVAVKLARQQRQQLRPIEAIVNDALRRGLRDMASPRRRRARFVTQPLEIGQSLVGSIDNIAGVLAYGEDQRFR